MTLKNFRKSALLVLSAFSVFSWTLSNSAFAHKTNVFAWSESGMVHTVSKFSGGRRAKNATLLVLDTGGKMLLKGRTDGNGEFSFPLPASETGLKIILEASMGHRSEWFLSLDEIVVSRKKGDEDAFNGEREEEKVNASKNDFKNSRKISFAEIAGGLACIVAISGFALFLLNRRKNGKKG